MFTNFANLSFPPDPNSFSSGGFSLPMLGLSGLSLPQGVVDVGGGPAFSMPNLSKEENQGPKKRGPKCKKEVKPEGGSVCIESKLSSTKPEKREKGEKCEKAEKGELNPEYILQLKSTGDDEDDDCLTLS